MNQEKNNQEQKQPSNQHWLLLLLWVAIGAILRFANLDAKPPWTDEFATLVMSLGRTFKSIPLDVAIPIESLLKTMELLPKANTSEVTYYLLRDDVHPPLYFVLAHHWQEWLTPHTGNPYLSIWVGRSLPALMGVFSIPAMFFLGRLAFNSLLVGHLAAAMMAVSPYGIFLAQEARHYSMSCLWVIASLCCLFKALQMLDKGKKIPAWLGLTWVTINTLGMATHFFLALTFIAETVVLIAFYIVNQIYANLTPESSIIRFIEREKLLKTFLFSTPITPNQPSPLWTRIYGVAAGTLVGSFVWLPFWIRISGYTQTQWIHTENFTFLNLINPLFQALAAWITMISLLPVESPNLILVIASGLVMLVFFLWALPLLWQGLKAQATTNPLETPIVVTFIIACISQFFAISYLLGIDITRGARYNFIYFPAVILLVAACMAKSWQLNHPTQTHPVNTEKVSNYPFLTGKKAVTLIWLMGLLSAITVVSNLGYQKYYRPDLLVPIIQQNSKGFPTTTKPPSPNKLQNPNSPVLIATNHETLVQAGEMMGLAWEFKHRADNNKLSNLQFILAHENAIPCKETQCQSQKTLEKALAKFSRPLDLWLLNFKAPVNLKSQNCLNDPRTNSGVNGYEYQHYYCEKPNQLKNKNLPNTNKK